MGRLVQTNCMTFSTSARATLGCPGHPCSIYPSMHPPFRVGPEVADPPSMFQKFTDINSADLHEKGEGDLPDIWLFCKIDVCSRLQASSTDICEKFVEYSAEAQTRQLMSSIWRCWYWVIMVGLRSLPRWGLDLQYHPGIQSADTVTRSQILVASCGHGVSAIQICPVIGVSWSLERQLPTPWVLVFAAEFKRDENRNLDDPEGLKHQGLHEILPEVLCRPNDHSSFRCSSHEMFYYDANQALNGYLRTLFDVVGELTMALCSVSTIQVGQHCMELCQSALHWSFCTLIVDYKPHLLSVTEARRLLNWPIPVVCLPLNSLLCQSFWRRTIK